MRKDMFRAALVTILATGMLAGAARAGDIYVSTNGLQQNAYANWTDAFTNLQAALDYSAVPANAVGNIYLAGNQTFSTPTNGAEASSLYVWQNATNVTLSGGWQTDAEPPVTRIGGTLLKKLASSGARRVLYVGNVSNAVIDTVTIRDGDTGSTTYGAGVMFSNSFAVIANSSIVSNSYAKGGDAGVRRGGGMAVRGGWVTVTNCVISTNRVDGAGQTSTAPFGSGLCVFGNGRVTVWRSAINRNAITAPGGGNGYGAGFGVEAGSTLEMYESVLISNTCANISPLIGAIGRNEGNLIMRNCLAAYNVDSFSGVGLHLNGGTSTLLNCTIVNNGGKGVQWGAGTVWMTNCIVWGHTNVDLLSVPTAGVRFSDIGSGGPGAGVQGCKSEDPRFADSNYFHLASTVSNYSGGYFSGGTWTTSLVHSALIDAGDTNSPYSREPAPNGDRVNMGYDGNTEVASLSQTLAVSPPAVTNLGALYAGHRTVTLYGQVVSAGYPNPQGFFRYWPVGGTTTETARAEQTATFPAALTGLTPGQSYQFVAVASNSSAEVVSDVKDFVMHPTPSYLYVATNGNDTAGTNWVTAYTTVQKAFDLAETGDTIFLAGHTFAGGVDPAASPYPYNAVAVWRNATNMAMKGGYDAVSGGGNDPGARGSTTTVKRTAYDNHVLSMLNVTNCTVDRVTFREGKDSARLAYSVIGTGVYMTNCWSVTLADCVIAGNTNNAQNAGYGIGLGLTRSSAVVTNCTIVDNYQNSETSGGTGIAVDGSSTLTAIRSFILRNKGNNAGGNGNVGMGFNNAGVLNLIETVLSGNEALNTANSAAAAGGANYGTLTMLNCLVASNRCYAGTTADGIHLYAGTATVVNCTFANNYARGIWYSGGTVAMTNCIVWGHTLADMTNFPASTGGVLSNVGYSCFGKAYGKGYGDSTAAMAGDYANSHCLTNDPLFAGAATNNYRLQTKPVASPAIDAGWGGLSGWMLGDTDLAGERRVQGGRIDMGAYESVPTRGSVLLVW